MRYDIAIVGGGIVGCAIAHELCRYNLDVIVLEKEADLSFGVSKANSGIIHGGHHASPNTLKGQLEWEGNQLWHNLSQRLDFGFKPVGEITVALHDEQLAILDELLENASVKGIPGVVWISGDEIRQREPRLSQDIIAGIYSPTTAVINPYEACFRLAEIATQNGVALALNNEVIAINPTANGFHIKTKRVDLVARYIINAAGLYADDIAEMVGESKFRIHPRKGEEYLLDKRLTGLIEHVIFPCPTPVSKGILMTPTYDGTIMIGPTAEMVDSKTDFTTTTSGAEQVFNNVQALLPGISEKDCIAEFAGLRAVADGDDFIIEHSSQPGFINVAGIQSPGLTAAPAIALMVRRLLEEDGLVLEEKAEMILALPPKIRFANLSDDEQIRLCEQNPPYSRIICRCEEVTEGEIRDAIRRGASTLDGIKFRTRAGMGRCQGGFCTWRCMQLLAEDQNTSLADVTKFGGNSWLVRERLPISEKETLQ